MQAADLSRLISLLGGANGLVAIKAASFTATLAEAADGIFGVELEADMVGLGIPSVTVEVNFRNLWSAAKALADRAVRGVSSVLP